MNIELDRHPLEVIGQAIIDQKFKDLFELSGLEPRFQSIASEAINHYVSNDLYHNVDHMFDTTLTALAIFDEHAEEFGLTDYDRQALALAALWHDADCLLELDERYATKENRSAHMIFNLLSELPAEDLHEQTENLLFAGKVAHIVLSTEPERKVSYGTVEWIMNKADVINLSGTKDEALTESAKLFIESLVLNNLKVVSISQVVREHSDRLQYFCDSARYSLGVLATSKSLGEKVQKQIGNLIPQAVKDKLTNMPL